MAQPVAYWSRTLQAAEQNLDTTARECLAIVEATKHFRPYLYGREFKLITDHKALEYLMSARGMPSDRYGKLTRWSNWLAQFDFTILH